MQMWVHDVNSRPDRFCPTREASYRLHCIAEMGAIEVATGRVLFIAVNTDHADLDDGDVIGVEGKFERRPDVGEIRL